MREIRTSGSEGGAAQSNALSLPLSKTPCIQPWRADVPSDAVLKLVAFGLDHSGSILAPDPGMYSPVKGFRICCPRFLRCRSHLNDGETASPASRRMQKRQHGCRTPKESL